jgi:hypothetical protein
MASLVDAILYYTFHFIYLGHPSDILARLWVAEDISDANSNTTNNSRDSDKSLVNGMRSTQAWQVFDDSMRQSYKATGIIVSVHIPIAIVALAYL